MFELLLYYRTAVIIILDNPTRTIDIILHCCVCVVTDLSTLVCRPEHPDSARLYVYCTCTYC